MVKHWLTFSRIQALFLKLYYEKAFDRVKHGYLWAAMTRLGLESGFIRLVQGLITSTASKLHLYGLFSGRDSNYTGVRQGCLLSPLIFSIIAQPLLDYLKFLLGVGCLEGLVISKDLTISYRLFADDMGLIVPTLVWAFGGTRDAIALYELASGAHLNLENLVIIPFNLPIIPLWLLNTRCKLN